MAKKTSIVSIVAQTRVSPVVVANIVLYCFTKGVRPRTLSAAIRIGLEGLDSLLATYKPDVRKFRRGQEIAADEFLVRCGFKQESSGRPFAREVIADDIPNIPDIDPEIQRVALEAAAIMENRSAEIDEIDLNGPLEEVKPLYGNKMPSKEEIQAEIERVTRERTAAGKVSESSEEETPSRWTPAQEAAMRTAIRTLHRADKFTDFTFNLGIGIVRTDKLNTAITDEELTAILSASRDIVTKSQLKEINALIELLLSNEKSSST